MGLSQAIGGAVAWMGGARGGRERSRVELADARRLADAERAGGEVPAGCAWLDDRTVVDVDLPLVFRAVDRTTTPTGAQALWRWLAAPALRLDVLAAREAEFARLAEPALRGRVRNVLGVGASVDSPHLPRLLWDRAVQPVPVRTLVALLGALIASAVLAIWVHPFAIVTLLLFATGVLLDDWANLKLAHQARALEVLAHVLATAARVADAEVGPPAARAQLRADLAALAGLRKRIGLLAIRDPFQITDLLRAGLSLRLLILGVCTARIDADRDRLRRVVLGVGELDAAAAVATLRAGRDDARVPELHVGAPAPAIDARAIAHPAIDGAIGNDVTLAGGGLIVTGSNMSGKSTFLRTLAVNAICAQSIHTAFGVWRASVFRVLAVMRVADDTDGGMSKYAVEVTAIGAVVAAASEGDAEVPALIVVDEPFSGTNPAVRVPIVVSVLTYLAARDLVIAATHDLDVAAQLDARFQRGYFAELEGSATTFDRQLRPGVSPGSNAVALLEAAGYPTAVLDEVARRVAVAHAARRADA